MRRRGSAEEVKWKKYSTTKKNSGYYRQITTTIGDEYSDNASALSVGSDYEWSEDVGWYLVGEGFENASDAVGCYYDDNGAIVEFTSYDESSGTLFGVVVADSEFVSTGVYYIKGKTSYGTVVAKAGEYPGTGSAFDGSPAEGWCVMLEGNTYYYYEKVQ